MPDLVTALSDRYVIARELGAGGMATVYLARDLKHDRAVAVKVLRPELAAAVGAERFLREIRVTANLHHPHILALYDSGEAAGFLYYVMPYVEGESLRARLEREKQLPLEEALQITREVADALGYAHSHGIVHRDIKPENILLESGHAVAGDFGIARAISAAGGETLTATGIAVGTPAYMSPEQAAGERELDGRSDLYALGCVLYEMLAGRPPFGGPTAESLVHQHLTAPPPSVTQFRATVSAELAQVVDRALAKTPADRFPSMAQFIEVLDRHAASGAAPTRRRPWGRWAPYLAGAALLVAAAVAVARWRPRPAPTLDPNVVAVLPFRVNGPRADIGYLREGMVDLLAAKLTGRGGPRAVDPRTVVNAWRRAGGTERDDVGQEEAERVARRAGAGRLLLGSVVGSTDQLTLSAALYTVGEADPNVQAAVAGPADSLLPLVDRLAARLLAREAGESERLLGQLTSTSLPALRAYLEGQATYRRGGYEAAAIRFNRALDLDSTFALAGLGLVSARLWALAGYDERGLAVAWAHRDRLSPGDSVLVEAMAAPTQPTGVVVGRFEQAVELEPDRPEFWYWEGEEYFHVAPAMGIEGAHAQAQQMFGRAVALDSTFSAPLEHLLELAAQARDTAAVRRLLALHLAIDSSGDLTDFARWRAALVLGDSVALRRIRARLPDMATTTLWAIAAAGVLDGVGLEDVDTAVAVLARRALPPPMRPGNLMRIRAVELDRGRPSRVLALEPALRAALPPSAYESITIFTALFGGGDSAAAAVAARSATRQDPGRVGPGLACAAALWREAHGQPADLARVRRDLEAPPPAGEPAAATDLRPWCDATLGALEAAHADPVTASRALARLDSTGSLPFGVPAQIVAAASFVSARLHEERGDLPGARAALRRQVYHFGTYLSTQLREEGRLAARMGDRDAAIRAYQHYLTLRADAEPTVQPEVDEVREALGRLVRE